MPDRISDNIMSGETLNIRGPSGILSSNNIASPMSSQTKGSMLHQDQSLGNSRPGRPDYNQLQYLMSRDGFESMRRADINQQLLCERKSVFKSRDHKNQNQRNMVHNQFS